MLRRLEKRILVDLPNKEARIRMFESFLPPVINADASGVLQLKTNIDYNLVAEVNFFFLNLNFKKNMFNIYYLK